MNFRVRSSNGIKAAYSTVTKIVMICRQEVLCLQNIRHMVKDIYKNQPLQGKIKGLNPNVAKVEGATNPRRKG